jgi:HAD superfamily phosphoserine phosphatase-like hydrolase
MDFDGTVVAGNTTTAIFERFARPGWRAHEEAYRRGELSVEQFHAAAFALVEATAEELVAHALRAAPPRPGLAPFVREVQEAGWLPVIVSNGFDLCVDACLAALGLDRVPRHAGRARLLYRWQVRYLSPRGVALEEGFKVSYVSAFRQAGDFVLYVGEGEPDLAAATLANVVFARGALLEGLTGVRPVRPFETFEDILEVFAREAGDWLAAIPGA